MPFMKPRVQAPAPPGSRGERALRGPPNAKCRSGTGPPSAAPTRSTPRRGGNTPASTERTCAAHTVLTG
eukprot:1182564-Pyramimonas_sp.AAC.1